MQTLDDAAGLWGLAGGLSYAVVTDASFVVGNLPTIQQFGTHHARGGLAGGPRLAVQSFRLRNVTQFTVRFSVLADNADRALRASRDTGNTPTVWFSSLKTSGSSGEPVRWGKLYPTGGSPHACSAEQRQL